MPPSENFRESLKAGRLQDALLLVMGQAVELKITTWVASETDQTIAPAGHRLQTRINLVQGDIENEIGDRFLTRPDYQPLRQFHREQVAASTHIIRQNINSLQQLFATLAHLHTPEQEQPEPQPRETAVHSAEPALDSVGLLTMEDLEPVMDEASEAAIGDEMPEPVWEATVDAPELPTDTNEPFVDDLGLPPSDWPVDETEMPTLDAAMGLEMGDRWSTEPNLVLPDEAEDWGEFVEFVEEPEEPDPYPAVFEEDLFPHPAPPHPNTEPPPNYPAEPDEGRDQPHS